MTQEDLLNNIDKDEIIACARFGELDELKEYLAPIPHSQLSQLLIVKGIFHTVECMGPC
jgi:hypothetical protein